MRVVERGLAEAVENVLTEKWQTLGLISCQVDVAPEAARRYAEKARERGRRSSGVANPSGLRSTREQMKRALIGKVLRPMVYRSRGPLSRSEWIVERRNVGKGPEYRKKKRRPKK